MTVRLEVEAEIRRLHAAESWPVGTIARQLRVHPDVVKRVLGLTAPPEVAPDRPLLVEPYSDFIRETLTQYPRLRATRLFDMVRPRGYAGSIRTLREYVATVRPRPHGEAYLRLQTLVGEQSQVDWAHVGKLTVPGGERALWLFVMVLSWSRAIWAEFVLDLSVHSLLRSLSRAATYFEGSTRYWLFDNPKTVVIERHRSALRFHPLLVGLSGRYCVGLRVCGVRKANEKGRVERAIRYLRERFLAGREIRSVEQGNRELLTFLATVAQARPHPTLSQRTVADCLAEERPRLLALPKAPPPTDQVESVVIDKTAFARFDRNDYSVPADHRQSPLTLVADDQWVRFLHGEQEVARHRRCWGRRQQIEDPVHRQAILEEKRGAREAKGQDRLRAAAPGIDTLFARWVESGHNVGSLTARTVALLDRYGPQTMALAVAEVIARGTQDPGAIAILCEQRRQQAQQPIPLDLALGSHVRDREVIPHALESYDEKPKRRR
jgi:transposase